MRPTKTSNDSGLSERKKNYQDYIFKTRTIPKIFYCNPPFVQAGQGFDRNQGNQSRHDSTHLRPEYASYEARLATFNNWPEAASQMPQLLAKAGFYYTGYADMVFCFACDGCLRPLQEGADPWIEHCREFSGCPFVKLTEGDECIDENQASIHQAKELEEANNLDADIMTQYREHDYPLQRCDVNGATLNK